jgi:hypothetical protein
LAVTALSVNLHCSFALPTRKKVDNDRLIVRRRAALLDLSTILWNAQGTVENGPRDPSGFGV